MRSAPRCDALTVAVEVLASAGDLLLNDVVTIPVLAAVRHDHRRIAGLLRIAVLWWTRSGVAAVVVRVAVARLCQIVAARCAIAVVLARHPGHAHAHNEHQSRKDPQHLYSSQTRCLNAHLLQDELTSSDIPRMNPWNGANAIILPDSGKAIGDPRSFRGAPAGSSALEQEGLARIGCLRFLRLSRRMCRQRRQSERARPP